MNLLYIYTMKKTLFAILISCLIFPISAQTITTKYEVEIPNDFTAKIDVVYKKTDNWVGKMDIYLPPNYGKPTPIIINIHGGGWNHGSKEKQTGFRAFFKENIAIANINYRLVDVAPAPAAIEDVRSTLIYLIRNAKELNIDTDKIVLMGGSAGGHLALCAGYLANNPKFDTDRGDIKNIKIAAIINKYGIGDMYSFSTGEKAYKSAVRWLGKNANNTEFKKSVSGMTYITKDSPATFIVHGDADPIVPYSQSVELHKKLVDKGVKTEFITVKGGEHGKFSKEESSKINKAIILFLKEMLQ